MLFLDRTGLTPFRHNAEVGMFGSLATLPPGEQDADVARFPALHKRCLRFIYTQVYRRLLLVYIAFILLILNRPALAQVTPLRGPGSVS